MAENKEKSAANKKATAKRDKNGKFVGEKSDTNSVKINVVKESDPKEKNNYHDHKEEKIPNIKGIFIHIRDVFPGMEFDLPLSTSSIDVRKIAEATMEKFGDIVAAEEPPSLTFNDKTFYSEESVKHLLADTILTCAKIAADEEQMQANGKAEKEKKEAELKKIRNQQIAEKMSKIAANIILGTFVFGFGCAAVFGIIQFIKMLTH